MRLCQCAPPANSVSCNRYSASERNQGQLRCKGTVAIAQRPRRHLDGWPCPLLDACDDEWTWNPHDCSHEVKLYGPRSRTVLFHPGWSNGTAAVRGTRPLLAPVQNGSRAYYWEIDLSHRVFGTSIMFGIGTKRADLHQFSFTNLLGKDEHSWAISHKGIAWHNGDSNKFTQPFLQNTPTTISLLLDWTKDGGVLEYYKDGKHLGIAFSQLSASIKDYRDENSFFYPMISSTAARTEMDLVLARRGLTSLQDRCMSVICNCLRPMPLNISSLDLPTSLRSNIRKRVLYSF